MKKYGQLMLNEYFLMFLSVFYLIAEFLFLPLLDFQMTPFPESLIFLQLHLTKRRKGNGVGSERGREEERPWERGSWCAGLSSGVNDICAGKNSDIRGCYTKNAIVTPHCSFSPLFPANPQRRMT